MITLRNLIFFLVDGERCDTVLLSASAALPLFRRSCCLGTSAVGCVASESMPSLPRKAFSVVLLFLLHNMNGGCDRGVKKTHTTREKLHCIVGLHLYQMGLRNIVSQVHALHAFRRPFATVLQPRHDACCPPQSAIHCQL